jgi:hypothetical protein
MGGLNQGPRLQSRRSSRGFQLVQVPLTNTYVVQSLSDRLSTMTSWEAVGFGGYLRFFHYEKCLIIRLNTILIQHDTPDS